jgi:hypothetical protein
MVDALFIMVPVVGEARRPLCPACGRAAITSEVMRGRRYAYPCLTRQGKAPDIAEVCSDQPGERKGSDMQQSDMQRKKYE